MWRMEDVLELYGKPYEPDYPQVCIELSVLSRQCLNRRIPDLDTMKREISAWENQRNAVQATVNWRFSVTEARVKLKDLYLYPCVNLS